MLSPKNYNHYTALLSVLNIAQDDLKEFLKNNDYTGLADYQWHNNFYGEDVFKGEVENWFTLPIIRGGNRMVEWQTQLPNLSKAVDTLPGVINFTLNAIPPGAQIRPHCDYNYDMQEKISQADRAYVILLCVDIPEADIDKCGMRIGDNYYHVHSGDIIAFDGGVEHQSWNFTEQWRYTINIDINVGEWSIDGS
jgi:hypothetical protein